MSEFTLPGRSRKRRGPDPREALIPVATRTHTTTAAATHLTDDRNAEPSFDDLIAGNRREPSHADLLAMGDEPIEQPRPKRYPGVATEAMAFLHALDAAERRPDYDRHAYDVDHLAPTPLCPIDITQLDTDEAPPTMPAAGPPRLLFDALDALDRLPGLYAVDAKSFEMAASIAAIQTYTALRPDLLGRHEFRMQVTPLAEYLAEPTPEPANHRAQLIAAWTSIHEAHTRFAAIGFAPEEEDSYSAFKTALTRDAFDELIGELIDDLGGVRGVFDAEADDIELYAIEASLPMTEAMLKGSVA